MVAKVYPRRVSLMVCNFDATLCKELFALPENEEPAVIIPLGYADDEAKEKKKKRKDINEIVK